VQETVSDDARGDQWGVHSIDIDLMPTNADSNEQCSVQYADSKQPMS